MISYSAYRGFVDEVACTASGHRNKIFPHAWPFLMRKSCIPHLSNGPKDLKLGGLTKNILLVQALEEFPPRFDLLDHLISGET